MRHMLDNILQHVCGLWTVAHASITRTQPEDDASRLCMRTRDMKNEMYCPLAL